MGSASTHMMLASCPEQKSEQETDIGVENAVRGRTLIFIHAFVFLGMNYRGVWILVCLHDLYNLHFPDEMHADEGPGFCAADYENPTLALAV